VALGKPFEPALGFLEIFLIQFAIYSLIWIISDYAGTYVSIIFPLVFLAVLLFSLLVELVEKSFLSGWYRRFMIISIVTPVLVGIIFTLIYGGDLEWLKAPF
jgi:hypothetical protein